MTMRMGIEGIQAAQAHNLRMLAALQPRGTMDKIVYMAAIELHRYAVSITHVDTGALRASHRILIEAGRARGQISIDPSSVNPRGQRPYEYGPLEHARGGSHAFYKRTVDERGKAVLKQAIDMALKELR